jgi:hypothetical protein
MLCASCLCELSLLLSGRGSDDMDTQVLETVVTPNRSSTRDQSNRRQSSYAHLAKKKTHAACGRVDKDILARLGRVRLADQCQCFFPVCLR